MDELERRLQAIEERLAAIEERLGGGQAIPPVQTGKIARPPTTDEGQAIPPFQTGNIAGLPSQNLENVIGAHWLNRIGIAAVLVGVAYFLKYAFENDWIGPGMRVA